MKYLKMLGLAAIAAMGLMAFLGASSASADVLCTENTSPCPEAKKITSITATLSAGTSAVLETTAGEELVTCTTSTVGGNIEHQGEGVNPSGKVTTLDWGTTTCNHTTDTLKNAKEETIGGELEIDTREVEVEGKKVIKNTVTSRGAEVTVSILGVSCVYGTGAGVSLGDLTTGTPATLHITAVVSKTAGSILCPGSARWTADYTITNHTSVFQTTK